MKNEKGEVSNNPAVFDAAIFDHFAHAVMDEMIRQCVQYKRIDQHHFRVDRTRLPDFSPEEGLRRLLPPTEESTCARREVGICTHLIPRK